MEPHIGIGSGMDPEFGCNPIQQNGPYNPQFPEPIGGQGSDLFEPDMQVDVIEHVGREHAGQLSGDGHYNPVQGQTHSSSNLQLSMVNGQREQQASPNRIQGHPDPDSGNDDWGGSGSGSSGGGRFGGRRPDRKTIAIALAIVGVAGSGMATWLAYQAGTNAATDGYVPYVAADYDETKRIPDDPGGLAVPDRDKLVFERLNGGSGADGVERLLPAPEEPVLLSRGVPSDGLPDRLPGPHDGLGAPQVAAAPAPIAPSTEQLEQPTAQPLDAAERRVVEMEPRPAVPQGQSEQSQSQQSPSGIPEFETLLERQPVQQQQPQAQPTPRPAPQPEFLPPTREQALAQADASATSVPVESLLGGEETASTPSALPTGAPTGAWRVQLASLRQQNEADPAWERLRQRHGGVLGRLALYVQEARLESGTFYRIQAGPLANKAEADAACAALKANAQACIVVAP
jgi:hypothetical protein